ncbi:MAG: hypothetical protein ACYC43_11610 [Burkholderiales bacterium]
MKRFALLRATYDWKTAMNQFAILYEDRFTKVCGKMKSDFTTAHALALDQGAASGTVE